MGSILSALKAKIADKYQGVASPTVIKAVQKASSRTGVDFAFLMEKASAESSFNPTAKSKSSSATGLFQFIEDTWLSMVKKHGDKFGLGDYADQIEMKNGRCCVDDSAMKKKILGLRNDPEISALMAGAYSVENKKFLENNTQGGVGSTEMYLAHFMGAGGATKFINCRDYDGDAAAAKLFPQQARANKGVFFDRATGKPRTLDQVYNLFDRKFTGGPDSTMTAAATPSAPVKGSATAPAEASSKTLALEMATQALPLFDDDNGNDDIIWRDDPRFRHPDVRRFGRAHKAAATPAVAAHRISPENILLMSKMQDTTAGTFRSHRDRHGYNS